MLNRIKISKSLVVILMVLLFLQIITGGYLLSASSSDKNLTVSIDNETEKFTYLDEAWSSLMKARLSVNVALGEFTLGSKIDADKLLDRADGEIKKSQEFWNNFKSKKSIFADKEKIEKIELSFNELHHGVLKLYSLLKKNEVQKFVNYQLQESQNKFDKLFNDYNKAYSDYYDENIQKSSRQHTQAVWMVVIILTSIFSITTAVWFGMRHVLILPLNSLVLSIQHIANGDLIRPIDVTGSNEIGTLAESLRNMQRQLAKTVGDVRDSANAIYSGASEIAAGNNDLSSRTEQQAASLEETAASMEELTATVRQNAENASHASNLALIASETAQRGGKVVDDVVDTMRDIGGSSKKIADIISVIDGIAFQTNILALNAAVEAARAGEQGRGFAVVAGEVRNLAQRSAQAAREIKTLIEDSVSRVGIGSELVEEAGKTMNEIVSAVTRVTDIMGEIASASDEQSRGIDQIGLAVVEMDKVTQQNAALVEQSAAAAASLEEQASRLTQAMSVFHIQASSLNVRDNSNNIEIVDKEGKNLALTSL